MPSYSAISLRNLKDVEPTLQRVFKDVLNLGFDHRVICGHRNKQDQDAAFASKNSKLKWPKSKHNKLPSLAVDAVPYPIQWHAKDKRIQDLYNRRMALFAGVVIAVARLKYGLDIRWGGDWDSDWDTTDERFLDYAHFEIRGFL
jgi:peptidoglycan L-alanyl-D-glutamate endopeptidase CwlK